MSKLALRPSADTQRRRSSSAEPPVASPRPRRHSLTRSSSIAGENGDVPGEEPTKRPGNTIFAGVVAHVDVRTEDGADVSSKFESVVMSLGGKVRKVMSENVTHLIFKKGSVAAYQKAQISRKTHIVNLNWLLRSRALGARVPEKDFPAERVIVTSTTGRKRRRSMEPTKIREIAADDSRFTSSHHKPRSNGSPNPTPSQSSPTQHRILKSTPLTVWKVGTLPLPPPDKTTSNGDGFQTPKAARRSTIPITPVPLPELSKTPSTPRPMDQNKRQKLMLKTPDYKNNPKALEYSPISPLTPMTDYGTPLRKVLETPNITPAKNRFVDQLLKSDSTTSVPTSHVPSTPSKIQKKYTSSIVLTSLVDNDRTTCVSTIEKLGRYRIEEKVKADTTHVIVGSNRRTLTVLLGILRGAWLVKPGWLYTSLERNEYVMEEAFEVTEWFPKAKMARLSLKDREKKGSTKTFIFPRNLTVYLGQTKYDKGQITELIKLAGGKLVARITDATLCIGTCNARGNHSITIVKENWLFDSIEQLKCLPYSKYTIDQLQNDINSPLSKRVWSR
ncbi:hypothetical protein BZG36_04400 [Bifiguratus adelaidae]|uniref:BRCT domain-containing protein n=1 Tax=Bifiguratus adelaidae TaxID=1938954 RepID=A0A261XVP8_9FUNG|nr:hypothetical protein BZG36_04400 [Bifiguratus adelaidae]